MNELHVTAPAAPAAAAAVAAEPAASPGARLRAERERRGLGIQQVTDALHVDARLVEAMEEDHFAAFDAPVYARGFLRKYAGWLELPHVELLGAYEQLHAGPRTPSLIPATSAMPRLHDLRALPIVLATVAALALVGGSLWWWLARTPAPRPAATAAAAAPARTATAPATPAAAPAGRAVTPARTAAVPAASTVPPAAAAAGALTLRASRECWAEIHDQGGTRLLYDLVRPGESRSVPGPGPWRVFLGYADGVALSIDGRTVAVPAARRAGATARFVVATDGASR